MTQTLYNVYEAIITRKPKEVIVAFPSELPSIDHIHLGIGWRIHTHQMTNRIHVRLDHDNPDEQIFIVAKRVVQRIEEEEA